MGRGGDQPAAANPDVEDTFIIDPVPSQDDRSTDPEVRLGLSSSAWLKAPCGRRAGRQLSAPQRSPRQRDLCAAQQRIDTACAPSRRPQAALGPPRRPPPCR